MGALDGKIAWITGAGSGIGQAGAEVLAAAGATVVLSGRRTEPLEAVAAKIGEAAEVEALDVADSAAVGRAAEAIHGRHGRLDILINSAGINVLARHWPEQTPEGWDQVVATNLNGAFYCIQAVLPYMRAQKDGVIVNISSWAGRYDTYLTGPAYNASKHGLLALNAHLNIEEGGNGIRACAICPGEVNTPILDARPVPVPAEEKVRMLQSADLGAAILFAVTMPARACINEMLISPTHNRLSRKPQ